MEECDFERLTEEKPPELIGKKIAFMKPFPYCDASDLEGYSEEESDPMLFAYKRKAYVKPFHEVEAGFGYGQYTLNEWDFAADSLTKEVPFMVVGWPFPASSIIW